MVLQLLRAFINRQFLIFIRDVLRFLLQSYQSLYLFVTMSNPKSDSEPQQSPASEIPPFDPTQPSVPISYPIKTLEELESRSYFDSFHYPFNKASVPILNGSNSLPNRRRLLVCHDMAGGYLDDKWIQGGTNPNAYSIWHWHLMDVFVYFSHSLVTLPPPCWTNTAHRHGVKVLGTFITEWDEGRAVCDAMLSTKESAQMYAERLAELAAELGFDGWLLWVNMDKIKMVQKTSGTSYFSEVAGSQYFNAAMHHGSIRKQSLCINIGVGLRTSDPQYLHEMGITHWINMEVKLDPGQITNLKEFVGHLSLIMHSLVPGSLVLWYDSVTIDGKLKWQDQLNEYNKPFFDICDGIFVNYTWKGDYPRLSAAVAGDRRFDVYMGIDIFGRNTFGGGQWNVNVALDLLRKEDISAAIFAPGWVYETNQPPDFVTAQNSWWSLVEKSWGVLRNYPGILPFYTNFDQGRGYHISVDGNNVSESTWCNISCQGFQPLLELADPSNPIQVLEDLKEASFSGGGNITFKGNLAEQTYFERRLFQGEFLFSELPTQFIYSVKSDGGSSLGLKLEFTSTSNERTSILLTSRAANHLSSKFSKVIMTCEDKQSSPGWAINEGVIAINRHTLTEIHAVCYKSSDSPPFKEIRSQHKPDGNDGTLASALDYFALLGHITIKNSDYNSDFPASSSWLVDGEYIKWTSVSEDSKTLNIKLSWKLKDGKNYLFPRYNVYLVKSSKQEDSNSGTISEHVKEYLGVAHVNCFYVSNLEVPLDISSLKFIVQTCTVDGIIQKLDESPFYQLEVEAS